MQVVDCYGIFDHMGEISFVLELMDGGTLADIVKKKVQGMITADTVCNVARTWRAACCSFAPLGSNQRT